MVWPGISLVPLSEELRKRLKLDDDRGGVVVFQVHPKTPLQIAGIKAGDLIIEINGEAVDNLGTFYRLINKNKKNNFTYMREGVTMETSYIINR